MRENTKTLLKLKSSYVDNFLGVQITNFKSCALSIQKSYFYFFNEGHLKMMKNAFYFMLKARFSYLKYLHFCPDFLII